ncbi:MAG: alanyl-tRNA editing protein [Pseudomonadota bacterium]
MTETLYRDDPYLRETRARVTGITAEGAVILDRTVFYPTGGGQPGDTGALSWDGGEAAIADTVKSDGDAILHLPAEGASPPPVGTKVMAVLDWERRYRHMRCHTGLHLLSVVVPLPVTGGAITAQKGRLDFDMPEAPEDKQALQDHLNALISEAHKVTTEWITDDELAANPGLVKTMRVKPPMGQGRVRLVRIGTGDTTVDLQPCGGTHVADTSKIGTLTIGKIEKKGKQNRRVSILLD